MAESLADMSAKRTNSKKAKGKYEEAYDIIAIISGPEPQRSIFEELVLKEIEQGQLKAVVVRGLPNSKEELSIEDKEVLVFNHLPTEELQDYILKSKAVVCRSGYSSIMDLVVLGKKAILIPTPGQTEQEYLASYHLKKGNFYIQKQNEFDLARGLLEVESL